MILIVMRCFLFINKLHQDSLLKLEKLTVVIWHILNYNRAILSFFYPVHPVHPVKSFVFSLPRVEFIPESREWGGSLVMGKNSYFYPIPSSSHITFIIWDIVVGACFRVACSDLDPRGMQCLIFGSKRRPLPERF